MNSPTVSRILSAIGFFVAGILAHTLFSQLTKQDPIDQSPAQTVAFEQEVRTLTEQLAIAQTKNATLQSKLDEKPVFESFALSDEVEEVHVAQTASTIAFGEGHFEEMMSRQVKQQVDVYEARLNLSDDQRGQLEEIMLMQMMQMRKHIGPNGPGRIEGDPDSPFITQTDIDNLAAEILSPEQLDEYDEMRAQEKASRSEMMATAQLSQIAPQLGLSETQKDLVYSIYYNQSLGMEDGFTNPESMQESQALADEQIKEILDDEQREVFKTIKENQKFGNFTVIAR